VLRFLFFINIIFAGALLLSYVSPYVDPTVTGFFAFFGLGYPFLLIINVLMFLFWIVFKPKYAILSVASILIGFSPLKRTFGMTKSTNSSEGFSVMTYNIGKANYDLHKTKGRQEKIDRFNHFVSKSAPNIICLQERRAIYAEHYTKIFDNYNLVSSSKTGTAIYTQFPVVDSGMLAFDTKFHNGTWADLKIGKDTCRIYSLHLSSNKVPNLTDNVKEIWDESKYILDKYNHHAKLRIKQLDQVLAHAEDSPHPVVINGDFNDVPHSYLYRKISDSYQDAFLEAGSGLAQTYRSRFIGLRIDYTFTNPHIKILNHEILDSPISDHLPVVTRMTL